MAKCNIHFHLILQLTLFLQLIILSQPNFLEAVTLSYNSSGYLPRCVEAERKALLKFKENLTDPSGHLSSWVGEDCCGWVGVVCSDHTDNVVKLDLHDDDLYEESPRLSGKLSPPLMELNHLTYLNLGGNNFDGMVPPQLGNLTNLHYLDLSYNHLLWASDLNWVSGLNSLEYLNLNSVNLSLSTDWLKDINLLPSLSELYLGYCNLEYPPSPPLSLSISNLTSLSVIDLSENHLISEVPPWLFNITTLTKLYLFYCNITGPISHLPWQNLHNLEVLNLGLNSISDNIDPSPLSVSITNLTSLSVIVLSGNQLISEVPPWLFNITTLMELHLYYCNITGPISHLPWQNLHNLEVLSLGFNSISDDIGLFIDVLSERSNISIQRLDLAGNHFSGQLGESLGRLTSLTSLSLSRNSISGEIPPSIGTLSFLEELDLSSNKMNGSISVSVGDLPTLMNYLNLGNNSFTGAIPTEIGTIMSSLRYLNLPMNFLNGTIPKSISKMEDLNFLDLSQNNLSGQMLDTWGSLTHLEYLDLSNNNLFGEIPLSICSSPELFWLDLSNNRLDGRLPLSLQNCTNLDGLSLGGNKFSGNIPRWLEKSLNLGMLSLRMNNLSGEIPQELCHLPKLHAIDLSHNNLSSTIPPCFGNFSRLIVYDKDNDLKSQLEAMDFIVNGIRYKYILNLYLLNIIDLSNNNLEGPIPEEITNLLALGNLNLSRNQLSRKIPEKIGGLKLLETLDLSYNHLTGPIPASMASLSSLRSLDLSFNNLTGPIPSSTQFTTFNNSIYEGNTGLCGPPLQTLCYTSVNEYPNKGKVHEGEGGSKDEDDEMFWFYVGLGLGFIMGFWGIVGTLAIKRSWRIALFKYFDGVNDKLFVFIAVNIARLKRMMKRERD